MKKEKVIDIDTDNLATETLTDTSAIPQEVAPLTEEELKHQLIASPNDNEFKLNLAKSIVHNIKDLDKDKEVIDTHAKIISTIAMKEAKILEDMGVSLDEFGNSSHEVYLDLVKALDKLTATSTKIHKAKLDAYSTALGVLSKDDKNGNNINIDLSGLGKAMPTSSGDILDRITKK